MPYNQAVRRDNFFARPVESPIISAANQILRPGISSAGGGVSGSNLPLLAKQNNLIGSANETKDSITGGQEVVSRRSSQNFAIRKPKLGDGDFDYSSLNLNLRYAPLTRLRDLETKMVDLKGDMDRRILQVIEENPMKFLQQLKFLEERETTLWADNMEKHNKNSELLHIQQARATNQMENVGNRMLQMQKQIEDLSFKNVELERNIQNLSVLHSDPETQQVAARKQHQRPRSQAPVRQRHQRHSC